MESINERLMRLAVLTVDCPIQIAWLSSQYQEGVRSSPYRGNGRDYCDFRDYRDGDKPTRINWKMYARRPERLMVTLLEEERNACVCVLADISAGMDMVSVGLSKRELACVLTSSIIRSATRTNDSALFATFDERGVKHFFGRRASHGLALAPAAVLDQDSPYLDEGASGLLCAMERLPQSRSLVFILIDNNHEFSAEELEQLFYLGIRHEVVFMSISDLRERELPATRLLPFLPIPGYFPVIDQSGHTSLLWTNKNSRERHTARFCQHENETMEELTKLNCRFASLHTEDDHRTRRAQLTRILSSRRDRLNLNEGEQA
ncbi:MAG: DUF58 domain-containing protein [Candidatus Melainabacteria bacterium]|nr:DUF58 domain-containing protein [Candidatus Melainabacteria bacterium]